MEMEANPRLLEKGSPIFQDLEHLKKPCTCKDSRQIFLASDNSVTMIWWSNSPKRNVTSLTVVASGL
jgi:hypothetical protein